MGGEVYFFFLDRGGFEENFYLLEILFYINYNNL